MTKSNAMSASPPLDGLLIRAAAPGDGSAIAALIRGGFPSEFLNLTIYGCPGIRLYIEDQIQVPIGSSNTVYAVATRRHRPVSCIELRRFPTALCLNYIAVHPRYRGAGLGRRLLSFAISRFAPPSASNIFLDVGHENVLARRWYEKLGFRRESTTSWWHIPRLSGERIPDSVCVRGFPQAEISQRKYGFSEFHVASALGEFPIGRLGDRYFRVRDPIAVSDRQIRTFLAALDPRRRVVLCANDRNSPFERVGRARRLTVFHRLSVPLESLMRQLFCSEGRASVGPQ